MDFFCGVRAAADAAASAADVLDGSLLLKIRLGQTSTPRGNSKALGRRKEMACLLGEAAGHAIVLSGKVNTFLSLQDGYKMNESTEAKSAPPKLR